MRFTNSVANTAQTNSFLKILTLFLSLLSIMAISMSMKLQNAPPLIIERACKSNVASLGSSKITEEEIKNFLVEATEARFNSLDGNLHLLSIVENKRRALEQVAFKKQEMKQTVLVNAKNITIDGSKAVVSTDRLISVKDIRSVFIFNLHIEFAKVRRSSSNPYGLVLTKVTPISTLPNPKGK